MTHRRFTYRFPPQTDMYWRIMAPDELQLCVTLNQGGGRERPTIFSPSMLNDVFTNICLSIVLIMPRHWRRTMTLAKKAICICVKLSFTIMPYCFVSVCLLATARDPAYYVVFLVSWWQFLALRHSRSCWHCWLIIIYRYTGFIALPPGPCSSA